MPFEMDSTISIHAPRKGGDFDQSTSPMYLTISIHAPARGATFALCRNCPCHQYFNPRPPREGGDDYQEEA